MKEAIRLLKLHKSGKLESIIESNKEETETSNCSEDTKPDSKVLEKSDDLMPNKISNEEEKEKLIKVSEELEDLKAKLSEVFI